MKGDTEEAVKAIGFDHTIILRPGLLVGRREQGKMGEGALVGFARGLSSISKALLDPWGQEADVVAKAAVNVGMQCLEGEWKDDFSILSQSDIVRLGRTEWKNDI